MVIVAATVVCLLALLVVFLRWAANWGSRPEERAATMPGDAWLEDGPRARVVMTRATSIEASADTVWPWLAQLGRGAGWYSVERLDNGGRTSARHIVSWIPEPRVGDASAIGYLRRVEPGRDLTWWVPGLPFLGAMARLVVDVQVRAEDQGARLVVRMSGDAAGWSAWPALLLFRFIDSIMAVRQLQGIRERVEAHGARAEDPEVAESGARDQYQLYEVFYASGGSAGVAGKEQAAHWRRAAQDAGEESG